MSRYFSTLSHNISSLINDIRSYSHTSTPTTRNDQRDISLSTSRNTYRRLNGQVPPEVRDNTVHGILEEDEEEDEEEEQDDNDEGDESDSPPPSYNAATTSTSTSPSRKRLRRNPVFSLFVVIGIGWTAGLYLTYPFPTTIPLFVGSLIILFGWTITTLTDLVFSLLRQRESTTTIMARYTPLRKMGLAISTVFLIYLFNLGFTPQTHTQSSPAAMDGSKEKYFIAANMHNNEAVLSEWSSQLIKLIFHLGRDNVYVSIYESNSRDSTKHLLSVLNTTLENLSIEHRIITDEDNKHWWPYATAVERIEYLANARNIAIEPLQSPDPHIRLNGYREYTKILFFNDVWFDWRDIVKLLNTRYKSDSKEDEGEYDQVCAMDFGSSGLYDTWVARDVCGTPLRPFWPYVKDGESIERIRKGEPIRVSACWNGVTVLNARPFLFHDSGDLDGSIPAVGGLEKRGWRMIDNSSYPHSVSSPVLIHQNPIEFRTSNISQCDHSECFLISYDLHRYYPDRPVKIYMNPEVKVAYERNWFNWHNVVLEIPIIKWWLSGLFCS
uniref:Alpha-1,3-mannosyltransferase CMT1 n=1 Tax=Kwoniella bestiolae CBS 10118 TaxID=1296100 RepID=A0A1B9GA29_9TREE|nr:hypothetical protein I302_02728 [Kwoniella bestiolae CBS 10118]OCF27878.1 hypothetical protein I302_02728 [Kwoniella bestiolae CBS 10118]